MTTNPAPQSQHQSRPRRFDSSGGSGRMRRDRFSPEDGKVDYKDAQLMRRFVNERGKLAGYKRVRMTAKTRRAVAIAVKRARHLALIPMAPNHAYVTAPVQAATSPRTDETQQSGARPAVENQQPQQQAAEASAPATDKQQQQPETQTDKSAQEQKSEMPEEQPSETPVAEAQTAETSAPEENPASETPTAETPSSEAPSDESSPSETQPQAEAETAPETDTESSDSAEDEKTSA